MVTVLGQEQTPIQFVSSGAVVELDASVVREGTPVINEAGALVALCTLIRDGDGGSYVGLIPIGSPPADPTVTTDPSTTTSTVPDTSTTTSTVPDRSTTTTTAPVPTAFAGIRGFGEADPASPPIIVSVIADGPAAVAGLAAGDRILAVDGAPVTRVDQVLAAIKAKRPGDTIVFTVIAGQATAPSTTTPSTTTPGTATPSTASTSTTTTSVAPPAQRDVSVVLGVYEPAV
jgi:S1-C subfamily serine protease